MLKAISIEHGTPSRYRRGGILDWFSEGFELIGLAVWLVVIIALSSHR